MFTHASDTTSTSALKNVGDKIKYQCFAPKQFTQGLKTMIFKWFTDSALVLQGNWNRFVTKNHN